MWNVLDPGLEHLHRHGRLWRWTTERRRVVRQLEFDALSLVPAIVVLALAPGGEWASPWLIAALVVVNAAVSLVRFDIGVGSTSPLIIVQVPLWYAVPPGWIPAMAGLSFVLGRLLERWLEPERPPVWRALMGATDAAVYAAPAAVFAVAGQPAQTIDAVEIFVLAFAAHAAADFLIGTGVSWFVHGVRPGVQGRLMVWSIAVDAALAPIGFVGAVVIGESPWMLIALVPLSLLLGEFARERRERIDQAVVLSSAYRGTAQLMGDVLEADDAYTGGEHTQGVVDLAIAVGLELRLSPAEMRNVEFGALLHDIGKLRVPNEIINKPGRLTDAEWEVIRQHPAFGQEMLNRVGGALAEAGTAVRAHHERWDGTGYPDGLAGDRIPIAARVITVCDSYSAMTTTRSYSAAKSQAHALAELQRCAGTQFDPSVVRALEVVLQRGDGHGRGKAESREEQEILFGLGATRRV